MHENWKPVVGFESHYEVSDLGRVRALERRGTYPGRWRPIEMTFPAHIKSVSTTPAGYKYVSLRLPNCPNEKHLLHRVVARAFIGEPPPTQPQVNHKDGDKANNRPENLEYCSGTENHQHATLVLRKRIGEAGSQVKLTEAQAIAAYADPRPLKVIASECGVSIQAIWLLKRGRNWGYLQRDGLVPTADDLREIKKTYAAKCRELKKGQS